MASGDVIVRVASEDTLEEVKELAQDIKTEVGQKAFGVIPQACKAFLAYPGDGRVSLYLNPPSDTVIDGQTLCKISEIIVRRSTEAEPKSPSDGELLFTLSRDELSKYASEPYIDEGLENGTTYYYTAFPYSTEGIYSASTDNRTSAAPSEMPKLIINFSASEAVGMLITATRGGTKLGTRVDKAQRAFFDLPATGEWNVSGRIIETGDGETVVTEDIYGYDWALEESNPESNITYPGGVTNASYEGVPARKESTAEEISLGDWQDCFENFVCARPVMLNFDGTVAYELDHSDQTKTIDGEESDISNADIEANAMTELPKRYIKRWTTTVTEQGDDGEETETNTAHFRISRMKLDNDYLPVNWLYGDNWETAVELDEAYLPMFEGSSVNSKVRSIAGQTPMNTNPGATEWTQIQALGDGWIFDDFADASLITDYMFMFGKSTDVQKHWGNGHASGGNGAASLFTTGNLKDKGAFCGGTGNYSMKFMWLENYYGDRWDRKMGLYYKNSILYAKMFPPYTVDGNVDNYDDIGRGLTGTSGGYIKEVSYDKDGMLPKTISGSSTTYVPDGCWLGGDTCFLLWGAHCVSGAVVGAAFHLSAAFSNSGWSFGPSLSYKKPAA